MRCNPLRWLWGLLPLILLAWVASLAVPRRIEADLSSRARALLAQRNLNWAAAEFSGRDAVLAGQASEESEQRQPASIVSSLWGVRTVDDRTGVLELIKNYTWSATAQANTLRLTGYIPTDKARDAVLKAAAATFPGRTIDDKLKLARGGPAEPQWVSAISFAMKQLVGLKAGAKAEIDPAGLTVEGEAETPSSYKTVKTALSGGVPRGVTIKADKVIAPLTKPYTWGAAFKGQQLELTGHVPDDKQRDAIVAEAKRLLPQARVTDKMVAGSGEPSNFSRVVNATLTKLVQMREGHADLQDTRYNIVGLTEREETANALKAQVKSDIPSSFRVIEDIKQDPRAKAEEEARRAAAQAAAAAAAEAQRRAAEEAQQRQLTEEQRRAAEEQRRAADEAQRREAEARRQAELQRRQAEEEAQRRAAEAQRKQAEEEAQKRAAAQAAAAAAAQQAARQKAEAARCQDELRTAARTGGINFQRASAEIEQRSHGTLDRLAQIAKTCPEMEIEVAGHTDAEGEPGRNQRLSDHRARSVADYLIKSGVPAERIVAVGFGDTKPIDSNETAEGRAKNRRIEFTVQVRR